MGLSLREPTGEAAEDRRDRFYEMVEQKYEVPFVARLFKDYVEVHTFVLVHLRWRFGEGPSIDVTVGFQGAKLGVEPKADISRKPRPHGKALRARYEMQLPVLVDVVKGVQVAQSAPNVAPLVVPSYVWLQKADRTLLVRSKLLDPTLAFPLELGRAVEDRELARRLDGFGNGARAVVANVKLPDEVIQGGPQVEHDLPRDECPGGFDGGQLVQVEAVLKSAPVRFGPHGPCVVWGPPGPDFTLEHVELRLCSGPLSDWPFEAPRHALPSR
jgi:hypothetical protein